MSMIVARNSSSAMPTQVPVRPRQPRPEDAALQVRGDTQSLSAATGPAAGLAVRGQQAASQDAGYVNFDNNPNTFRTSLGSGQNVNVTGLQAVGAEVKLRYQDAAGSVHTATLGPQIAQEVKQRDALLGQLQQQVAAALNGGVISGAEQKQLDGMFAAVRDLQVGLKQDVGQVLGRLQAAPGGVLPIPAPVLSSPAPSTTSAYAPRPAFGNPAAAPAAGQPAAAPSPSVADRSKAVADMRMSLSLIANSNGDTGQAALHLVETRPELLAGATTQQLGQLVGLLAQGYPSDAERGGILKVLGNRNADDFRAIIQNANSTDEHGDPLAGPQAVGQAFIDSHNPTAVGQEAKLAKLCEDRGLTGENSPFRNFFLNNVYFETTDRDGGWVNITGYNDRHTQGNVDNDSWAYQFATPLLLTAALPAEKGNLLAGLAAHNFVSEDGQISDLRAKQRILDSFGSRANFDEAMAQAQRDGVSTRQVQYGVSSLNDLRAQLP